MGEFTTYDPNTGRCIRAYSGPIEDPADLLLPGEAAISGLYAPPSDYVLDPENIALGLAGKPAYSPNPLPLPARQAKMKQALVEVFNQKLNNGFTFQGHPFQADEVAQVRLAATLTIVTAGAPLPAGFFWRDTNNQAVPMDKATFIGFCGSAFAYAQTMIYKSFALKDAIASSDNPEAVDIQSGW